MSILVPQSTGTPDPAQTQPDLSLLPALPQLREGAAGHVSELYLPLADLRRYAYECDTQGTGGAGHGSCCPIGRWLRVRGIRVSVITKQHISLIPTSRALTLHFETPDKLRAIIHEIDAWGKVMREVRIVPDFTSREQYEAWKYPQVPGYLLVDIMNSVIGPPAVPFDDPRYTVLGSATQPSL